jgi:hypothetical protein
MCKRWFVCGRDGVGGWELTLTRVTGLHCILYTIEQKNKVDDTVEQQKKVDDTIEQNKVGHLLGVVEDDVLECEIEEGRE